jgi:hypothetical protein
VESSNESRRQNETREKAGESHVLSAAQGYTRACSITAPNPASGFITSSLNP